MKTTKNQQFAGIFNLWLKRKKSTQWDISKGLGLNQSQISRFQSGKRLPSIKVIIRICETDPDLGRVMMEMLYPQELETLDRIYAD